MKEVKQYILKAVKELKKLECKCVNKDTCKRCIAIMNLNSIHNFIDS